MLFLGGREVPKQLLVLVFLSTYAWCDIFFPLTWGRRYPDALNIHGVCLPCNAAVWPAEGAELGMSSAGARWMGLLSGRLAQPTSVLAKLLLLPEVPLSQQQQRNMGCRCSCW